VTSANPTPSQDGDTPLDQLGPIANLCRSCNVDFGSLRAFDVHRVGSFENGRRCLHGDELEAAGLVLNERGRWSVGKALSAIREAFLDPTKNVAGA
jgi:hypothetical protein